MYNSIDNNYIENVVQENNKQNILLLRVYANEPDYENNVYTEITGDNISRFSYEHSINSNNYLNFGDVCAGNIQVDLLTKGYVEDNALISLFKEFAIIKPYILQTGHWRHLVSGYGIRGMRAVSQAQFDDLVSKTAADTDLAYAVYTDKAFIEVDELPETGEEGVYYLVLSDTSTQRIQYEWNGSSFDEINTLASSVDITGDYVFQGIYCFKNDKWDLVKTEGLNQNPNSFNLFPLGKFYITDIKTSDYYRNASVTAYDVLGFTDFNAVNIDGLAPAIDYKDQEGLVNYFLWKNGFVQYDEERQILTASFSQYVSYILGSKHTVVTELPAEGVAGITYLILRADEQKYDVWLFTSGEWHYNGTTNVGTYTSFVPYYPDNNTTVRTLLSYLAQQGDIEGRLEWLNPKRTPYNVVINRDGNLEFRAYSVASYGSSKYKVNNDQILNLTLSGLPDNVTTVGMASCSCTITDEDSGNSKSESVIGNTGSALSMSFPTIYTYETAVNALERLIELLNPLFTNGVYIMQTSDIKSWATGIDQCFKLNLLPSADSRGFTGYWCVSQSDGSYAWEIYNDWKLFDYLPASLDWLGDLNLECGDCISIDDELGITYNFPIMSIKLEYDGAIIQTLSANGTSAASINLEQSMSGASSLGNQINGSYTLVQNSIKKIANTSGEENTGMVALIDDGTDNITNALIVSEYSSEDSLHNWLNEGTVIKIDSDGIKKSAAGYRGDFSLLYNFNTDKVLWSGALYMTETQTITLSNKVSNQNSGIVLVFSAYNNGALDSNFRTYFIPKEMINLHGDCTFDIPLMISTFSRVGAKILYISNDSIKGHSQNDETGTGSSGITYNNKYWVLRYVIGV